MLDETLDSVTGEDVDDMEEEIQTEVNKVRAVLIQIPFINKRSTLVFWHKYVSFLLILKS